MSAGFKNFHRPISGKSQHWGLREIVNTLSRGEFDLDPIYQRGHVWDEEHQKAFLGFYLEGGVIPTIYLRELSDYTQPFFYEVVDGKQRLTALQKWWNNEIPAVLSSGREVWQREFDEIELRQINSQRIASVILEGPDSEIMEVYLRLNSCGVAHTKEELDTVRDLLKKVG